MFFLIFFFNKSLKTYFSFEILKSENIKLKNIFNILQTLYFMNTVLLSKYFRKIIKLICLSRYNVSDIYNYFFKIACFIKFSI